MSKAVIKVPFTAKLPKPLKGLVDAFAGDSTDVSDLAPIGMAVKAPKIIKKTAHPAMRALLDFFAEATPEPKDPVKQWLSERLHTTGTPAVTKIFGMEMKQSPAMVAKRAAEAPLKQMVKTHKPLLADPTRGQRIAEARKSNVLNPDLVRTIRALADQGKSVKDLRDAYPQISGENLRSVIKRNSWNWVK